MRDFPDSLMPTTIASLLVDAIRIPNSYKPFRGPGKGHLPAIGPWCYPKMAFIQIHELWFSSRESGFNDPCR
jgi:hypothetical protein